MTDKGVNKNLPVIFQKLKEYEVNDVRFQSMRIWILHTGLNYNGSIFEKEKVEKNLHTLANTPVLAFIEENSEGETDFSDHRMVLERKEDGEIGVKYLGQAIGVIPESHNAHWEFRVGDDGVQREYLVCDALLWKKWDDPIDIMKREQKTWQSMELSENYSGYWNEDGHFVFESFEFNGACLLSNVDTLPAMNNSTAELVYTRSTTDKVFTDIKNKLDMFNKAFSSTNEEGGNNVSEEIKDNEEVVVEEVVEETPEVVEQEFEATEEVTETIEETAEIQEEVEVVEEDVKPQDETPEEEPVEEFDYKAEYETIKAEYENLKSTYSVLEEEVVGLRQFKQEKLSIERSEKEESLFESFSAELTEDEMKEVKETASEFTLEQIEEKLFTLVGKKKANFSKQTKKEKPSSIKIEFDHKNDEEFVPYGGILNKYIEK